MARTVLQLPAAERDALMDVARRTHPNEACGLLIGDGGDGDRRVERAVVARNVSPRPRDRYDLDPQGFVDADRAARRDGLEIVGIWHSHPDQPAEPSATDREGAWRGYSYLIVSISAGGTADLRAWRFDGQRFSEEKLLVEDPIQPDSPGWRATR